jgi:peptide/nickel transport system permease protein
MSSRARLSIVLLALIFAAGLVGLVAPPFDPLEPDLGARLLPPSPLHWMGTDPFGRDVLSRLLAGAVTSIAVSVGSVVLATVAGTSIGLVAGYFGGRIDRAVGFATDSLMAFPGVLLALALLTVIGPHQGGVVLALGLALLPTVVRVVRASTLSVRRNDYVEAALAMGRPHAAILLRHVLPNIASPLVVLAASLVGVALLAESALAFLGLGVPPPRPTWGGMLAEARPYLDKATWLAVFPGLAISIALLAVNLAGDALRDRLDPRLRRT